MQPINLKTLSKLKFPAMRHRTLEILVKQKRMKNFHPFKVFCVRSKPKTTFSIPSF